MSFSRRLRRVLLFVPGDDMHKIKKAAASNADSVILDLEDGVANNRKEEARHIIVEALQTLDFGKSERLVRINSVGSGLEMDDLTVTLPARPSGYVLPKVNRSEDIGWLIERLDMADRYEGWEDSAMRALALIETPLGVVNLKTIAMAGPRLDALIFGAEDLAGAMGAVRTKAGHEVFYARSAVVLHAAAYDLQAIDGIYADFKDSTGLQVETEQAVNMGFTGKLAIHPAQLEPILQILRPSEEALAYAQRLIQAYKDNQQKGQGAFNFEGKMVDSPMLLAAQNLLRRAGLS